MLSVRGCYNITQLVETSETTCSKNGDANKRSNRPGLQQSRRREGPSRSSQPVSTAEYYPLHGIRAVCLVQLRRVPLLADFPNKANIFQDGHALGSHIR